VRDGFVGRCHIYQANRAPTPNAVPRHDWIEGVALDEWVRRRTADRDPVDDLKVLLPIAVALDLMHSGAVTGGVPVVHRDVKPSNIRGDGRGTVLVDFVLFVTTRRTGGRQG